MIGNTRRLCRKEANIEYLVMVQLVDTISRRCVVVSDDQGRVLPNKRYSSVINAWLPSASLLLRKEGGTRIKEREGRCDQTLVTLGTAASDDAVASTS